MILLAMFEKMMDSNYPNRRRISCLPRIKQAALVLSIPWSYFWFRMEVEETSDILPNLDIRHEVRRKISESDHTNQELGLTFYC